MNAPTPDSSWLGTPATGRNAERGGDRRDRAHDRAGDVGAVEPHLQHLDRRLDVQPRLRVGLECSFTAAAAAAACVAVRRRRSQIVVTLVARGHGADARLRRVAAKVETLCGDVAVELVERRQRGSRHLRQLRVQ